MPTTWRARNVPVPEAYLLCLAAGVGLHRLRRCRLPGRRLTHHLLGWPLLAGGLGLVVGAVRAAGEVDLASPDRLVTAGPYRLSRNPMYAGWALASLGAGVIAGSGWLVAAVPVAARWAHRDVLREEIRLAESLGAEFTTYRARVPRYL